MSWWPYICGKIILSGWENTKGWKNEIDKLEEKYRKEEWWRMKCKKCLNELKIHYYLSPKRVDKSERIAIGFTYCIECEKKEFLWSDNEWNPLTAMGVRKMFCKRCGTKLKSKYSEKTAKIAKALRMMGFSSSGKLYWCPKCYPNKGGRI